MLYAFHTLDKGWSCPISLKNALERLGHIVKDFNLYALEDGKSIGYTDQGLRDFLDQQSSFDAIFLMDYGQFFSPLFKYIEIPAIAEMGDDPQAFNANLLKAPYFNVLLSPDYVSTQKYVQAGYNAKWFTHWSDLDIHHELPEVKPDKFIVTSVDENRGNGFIKKLRGQLGDIFLDDRYFYAFDHTRFMARGRAVLQHSQFGEITRRPIEAMACGKLVFTDRLSPERNFESLFTHGESIVFYDGLEDCVQKIKHFSQHLDIVQQIAENGRKIVLAAHTSDVRAKQLMEYVNV